MWPVPSMPYNPPPLRSELIANLALLREEPNDEAERRLRPEALGGHLTLVCKKVLQFLCHRHLPVWFLFFLGSGLGSPILSLFKVVLLPVPLQVVTGAPAGVTCPGKTVHCAIDSI